MSSSLISTIKQAILTETPSGVGIHERTLISLLLEYNKQKNAFSKEDFRVHSYRGKSLVITRHIIHFFQTYVVLAFIWLCYAIYNLLHWRITGRWRGMRPVSGINTVIATFFFILFFIFLFYILAFLIREVVLYPNDARINEQGVVTIEQPFLESQSFLLLNAATYWTPTDIAISKGDNVYITVSGSMYGDIGEMCKKAENNDKLLYSRCYYVPNGKKDTGSARYCIYNENDAYFGSILYQICKPAIGPTACNNDSVKVVHQLNFDKKWNWFKDRNYSFEAKEDGILYLCFNDILLNSDLIDKLNRDKGTIANANSMWRNLVDSIKSNIPAKYNDTVAFLKNYINDNIQDSTIWFQDNLGEVLVNIRIEKSIWHSDMFWLKKPIVWFNRELSHIKTIWPWDERFLESRFPLFLLILIVYFVLDVSISCLFRRKKTKSKKIVMLTKEEFRVLVMLYAANIDGNIHKDEVETMLNKADASVYKKMKKQFKKMSDIEVLASINENKEKFASTQEDKQRVLDDIRDVIAADAHNSAIENHLLRVIGDLLK